jgi:hypothetical protein
MNQLFLVSLLALEFGLQALIGAGLISSFFPISTQGFLNNILPFFADMVRPEREMTLYGFFILATAISLALILQYGRHLATQQRVIFGAVCLILQLTAIFHILLHHDPLWARILLYAAMVGFAAGQFLVQHLAALKQYIQKPSVRRFLEVSLVVLTAVMLYVPDQEAATARIYMGDHFHHFDQSVVGPAWAALAGDTLNVDVISQYGLGMPIMIGHLAQVFGGSYTTYFTIFMFAALVYFLLWYFLLRGWLNNVPLAFAGTWLAIKVQMFHPGAFPFALTYPSATVIRFFWDILFLISAWKFLTTKKDHWLISSAVLAGIAVFYMSSTGLCLALTFYALLFISSKKISRFIKFGAILPVMAIVLIGLSQGVQILTPHFWKNIGEFNNYFLSGFGTVPIYESLLSKNYWVFWVGILIPLAYVWTAAYLGAQIWTARAAAVQQLGFLIAIYGLMLYHYYIARSAPTSFYTVAVSVVALVCYWIYVLTEQLTPKKREIVHVAIAAGAFMLLWVEPRFAAFPNAFNSFRHYESKGLKVMPLPDGNPYFSHNVLHTARIPALNSLGQEDEGLKTEADFKDTSELKNFFRQEFDFSEDAKLISSMTKPEDKVALISSFDVRILMQANRRPFFYHYPVFLSRPMRMRGFAVPAIYTVDQIKRTITQMETDKPEYIFIERIYSRDNTGFADRTNALQLLLLYVHTHYDVTNQAKYLMALKRKGS